MLIISYNIHHYEGIDEVYDFDRFETLFREQRVDLAGLNEVYHPLIREQQTWKPLEMWERSLGLQAVFGRNLEANRGGRMGNYGNALLSRYPVRAWENHLLPCEPSGGREEIEQRGLLEVTVDVEGKALTLFVTHLHHGEPEALRAAQADAILAIMRRCDMPAILMGDMNDLSPHDPGSPPERCQAIARLLDADLADSLYAAGADFAGTVPVPDATHRIDFILVSPDLAPHLKGAGVLRTPLTAVASDHYPVWAELAW